MPVGISFENSSLKASFSLSSLPASEVFTEKPVKLRLYNSLTKNRVKATAVRRSWGSTASDHREEFWSVLQANYNYIMDNQLIDKCEEVNDDLSTKPGTWTLKEFYAQFSELYSWLNSVQETIYGKEENITDKALRAHCVNMVLEKSSSLKLFNDQASQLVQFYPEVQEEVGWRATHLNSKWDSILSILGPSDCDHCDQDSCLDIDHELKCLRTWFKMMESCLQPLDFRAKYTKTEIEAKALELNVLHRDIESHGKIVGSVVKLCKKSEAKCSTANARRIANGLERRWHLLFLRSLEWQCYLESLSKKQNIKTSTSSSGESDSDCYKEPASKYPRLSGRSFGSRGRELDNSSSSEDDSVLMTNKSGMSGNKDEVDASPKCPEDANKNRKTPNSATYFFKHEDTDSDIDKIEQIIMQNDEQSTMGETSEEEWTYTVNKDVEQVEIERIEEVQVTPKVKSTPDDKIRRLVIQAEELVTDKTRRIAKKKVNKWLNADRPDDSCDASGEDDEKESHTSEEFETSTTTLREQFGYNSQNTSFTELPSPDTKRWSGSFCLNKTSTPGMNFSISESALNKMSLSPKSLTMQTSVSTNNFTGNNSTSSTVEEVSQVLNEKSSPMRRKKSKLRKKSLFGKSDTYLFNNYPKNRHQLIKSGSFSGTSSQIQYNERHVSSDPPMNHVSGVCETSTTSGADSDDDVSRRLPSFKIGHKTRYLLNDSRDESPGKVSLKSEEQSSSISEAWDNYQEKYLSEAYSESHDSDAARKLLNFGEDYRSFLDSQSDWSAMSDMSPKMKRKSLFVQERLDDSTTEEESLQKLLSSSRSHLDCLYKKIRALEDNEGTLEDIDEMLKTCEYQIPLLSQITDSSEEYKLSVSDKAVTTGLLTQWKTIKLKTLRIQERWRLQKQIADLKKFISAIDTSDERAFSNDSGIEDISNEIEAYKKLLDSIRSQGTKLSSLNAIVHRFTLENSESIDCNEGSLKAEVSELYELFDNARTTTTEKLRQIENLLPAWKTLESRLEQFQNDLKEDEKNIQLLNSVLQNGSFTDQTATCVRDVAKVLSETTSYQGYPLPEFFTEGSFSDSGISDEGSEHEIGERQGRLAAIRRLVRQLEVNLPADSKAKAIMKEKLNSAEEELKILQGRCRSLIVRTAAYSATPEKSSGKERKAKPSGGDGDPDDDPSAPSVWYRGRMFKTALAFQLVILTFVCLSYLYEPQCCDYMNNYSWTLSPKLHYEGRPPI